MKKSFMIASIVALGGLSMLQTACDNYDDLIPQEYNCILSLQQYGEQEIVMYRTGEPTVYEITTLKTGNVPTSTASASIQVMSEVQFAEYCLMTGKKYKRLGDECYKVVDGNLTYSEGDKWLKSSIAVNYDETAKYFNGTDECVIPVMLTSESDSCLSTRRELMLKVSDMMIPSVGFERSLVEFTEDFIGNGTETLEIPVLMPIDNLWSFSFDVTVDASLADGYNVADANAYSVEVTDFVPGENGLIKISIDKSKLGYGMQAIPLRISACSNEGFDISGEASKAVVIFNKTVARSELSEIFVPKDKIGGWGWATYQSDGNGGWLFGDANHTTIYDGQGKDALFDNNLGTWWHGCWGYGSNHAVYGQYIDFELSAPANHFAYDLWARDSNANGAPKKTDIYGSTDGQNWIKLKTVYSTLTAGGQKFESSVCSSSTQFTHIRFAVVESNAGDVRVSGKYWNCSEMKLYAK